MSSNQRPPKVFVPQVPSTLDVETGIWVPKISLEKAKRFGDIEVLMKPGANRAAVGQIAVVMRELLQDAQPGDFLVPTGDPALIAIASIYLSRKDGHLRLLKWDNRTSDYTPMEIKL